MIPGKTYSPKDVIDAAWRRRWWIAVSFVVFAGAAFAIVMTLPRSYRSLATLQVVSDPGSGALAGTAAQTRVADRLSSIGQATLTRSRLETIMKDLDLYVEQRQSTVMENVIEQMRGEITFKSTDRDVFVLGFTAKDPHVAQAVATRLTSLFLEENARDRGQRAEANATFVDAQLADVRRKLDEQDQQVKTYQARYAGQLPSQLAANMQELSSAQTTVRALLDAISRDQTQRQSLQLDLVSADAVVPSTSSAAGTSTGDGTTSGGGAVDPLEAARATLRSLELRLTPEHPEVQRQKGAIARLEQQHATDETAMAAGAAASNTLRRRDPLRSRAIQVQIATLDRQIAANQEEVRRLRTTIDDHSRRIDATPVREAELATLNRDYDDTKRLYSNLASQHQNANMVSQLESKSLGDRFRVVEAAQLPERPASQSRTSTLIIGLLAALGMSLGLGALVEYRDASLRTEDDITVSLRLPVLATIPNLGSPARGRIQ